MEINDDFFKFEGMDYDEPTPTNNDPVEGNFLHII